MKKKKGFTVVTSLQENFILWALQRMDKKREIRLVEEKDNWEILSDEVAIYSGELLPDWAKSARWSISISSDLTSFRSIVSEINREINELPSREKSSKKREKDNWFFARNSW